MKLWEQNNSVREMEIRIAIKARCEWGYWWARIKLSEENIAIIVEKLHNEIDYKNHLDNYILAAAHWKLKKPQELLRNTEITIETKQVVEDSIWMAQQIMKMWWNKIKPSWNNLRHTYM